MARLKSFRAEYGTSVEVRGAWHKLSCSLEVEFDETDDSESVRAKVWNTVYAEIEKQLSELMP